MALLPMLAPSSLPTPLAPRALPAPGLAGPAGAVGVLGGGQLGRMFVHAAQAHGFRVVVLDPDACSPAGAAADVLIVAPYGDADALATLQAQCAAVTTEFENVPAQALQWLAGQGLAVSPPASAVQICQHRGREKKCFEQAGVACAPYALIAAGSQLDPADAGLPASAAGMGLPASADVADMLPGILKTASLGYDGKGQRSVQASAELVQAWQALGRTPCILEKRLPLHIEISVIVARARDGSTVHLPVQQNLHRNGVLAVTQVPAPDLPAATARRAVDCALTLAAALDYVGVLCVEFFVLADGSLVANEMAPRPHNSGHYSIDACDQSQFDLQLRTLVGWPLQPPRQHSAAVMLNLMGDLWFGASPAASSAPTVALRGGPSQPDWSLVLDLPGVHLHLYGKEEPRPGRKMGHLTVTAAGAEAARTVALQVAARLGLPAF